MGCGADPPRDGRSARLISALSVRWQAAPFMLTWAHSDQPSHSFRYLWWFDHIGDGGQVRLRECMALSHRCLINLELLVGVPAVPLPLCTLKSRH